MQSSPPPQLPATGVLQPLHADETFVGESEAEAGGTTTQQGSKRNSAGVLPESVNSEFHVFTWMDIARPQGVKSAALNYNKIIEQLTQAEDYLSTSTTWAQRKAYKACRDSTAQKVHAYLEKRGKDFDNVAEGDDERRNGWAAGVDLYNAAEIVFSFFLPKRLSGDAPTVRKFWGAIESIIEVGRKQSGTFDRKLTKTLSCYARTGLTDDMLEEGGQVQLEGILGVPIT